MFTGKTNLNMLCSRLNALCVGQKWDILSMINLVINQACLCNRFSSENISFFSSFLYKLRNFLLIYLNSSDDQYDQI